MRETLKDWNKRERPSRAEIERNLFHCTLEREFLREKDSCGKNQRRDESIFSVFLAATRVAFTESALVSAQLFSRATLVATIFIILLSYLYDLLSVTIHST